MTNESNKQLVRKLNKGFEDDNTEVILSCLADDVQWSVAGAFSVQGISEFEKQIHNENFTGAPVIKIKNEISEGDYLAVEGDVESRMIDGTLFRAFFHNTYFLQDGKVKRMTSYVVPVSA